MICRILLDLLSAKDVSENYYYFFLKFWVLEQGHLGNYIRERKLNIFFFFYAMLFWYNSGNEPRFKIFKFSGTWSFTAMLGHNSLWSVNQFCDISSISSKGIEASINFFFSKCSFKWYIKKSFFISIIAPTLQWKCLFPVQILTHLY